MGRTVYFYAQTLDGYIADADGGIDWLTQHPPGSRIEGGEPVLEAIEKFVAGVGAFAMGSTTYEYVLENSETWPYEGPAWIFTTREWPVAEGGDIRFTQAPVAEVHGEMAEAAGDRDVWIVGGGGLAQEFHAEGLLDEVHARSCRPSWAMASRHCRNRCSGSSSQPPSARSRMA